MTDWLEYAVALTAFFGSHFLPTRGGLRERMIGLVGRPAYFSAYGALSLLVLAWVIIAAGRAPFIELWPQLDWHRWVPNLVMPLALFLAVVGIGVAYPFTLGGRRERPFDPLHPGFAAVTRHPLLWALVLWSGAHLVPNGDLAHVVLFGSFLLLSLAAMPMFDARARRALGPTDSAVAFRATSVLSLSPLRNPVWLSENETPTMRRLALALAIWAVILWAHQPVIGVSPLPV